MFLSIVGWLFILAASIWASALWLMYATSGFGLGQPIRGRQIAYCWVALAALIYWWVKVFQWAPFSISAS